MCELGTYSGAHNLFSRRMECLERFVHTGFAMPAVCGTACTPELCKKAQFAPLHHQTIPRPGAPDTQPPHVMKPNIRLSLFRLIPVSLLALLRNVVSKLTGNPALPTPPVTLIAMTAAGDALQLAIDNAQFGSRHDREVRDTAVVKVRSMLTQIGNYVRTTANGDAVVLASSGFAMAKTPEPIGLPEHPKA